MDHWTELQIAGQDRWQTLLDEAENRRRVKNAATKQNKVNWLTHSLPQAITRSHARPLRPLKARE